VIVLDASAVAQLVLGSPGWREVEQRVRDPEVSIHAPHLLLVEVAQVIRRQERARAISARSGAAAMTDLAALDLTLHGHDVLLPRIWELRVNLSAYDAAYVALAEALGAPLLTFDSRLARAPGHGATVEVLSRD
jgi:predicted nucleic acid-binding protein